MICQSRIKRIALDSRQHVKWHIWAIVGTPILISLATSSSLPRIPFAALRMLDVHPPPHAHAVLQAYTTDADWSPSLFLSRSPRLTSGEGQALVESTDANPCENNQI